MSNEICVAIITSCHGVKGHVKLKTYLEHPDELFQFTKVFLADKTPVTLTAIGNTTQHLIAAIKGINDRNEAETYRNKKLYVTRDQLPEIDEENAFYIEDLIGLDVYNAKEKNIGTIKNVANYGAGDLVEIAFNKGDEEFFAFTAATFPEIDCKNNRINFIPPIMEE